MKFACTITRRSDGRWSVRHLGTDTRIVEITAASRDEALQKMRQELHYRLELSPCCGELYKDLPIELVEES